MAVLKGEGRVPILFGSLPLPIPPNRPAYVARPDVAGSFATVVIAPDDTGISPSVKTLARHLARHGYAVLVPALRESFDGAISDVVDAIRSARVPGTDWADGHRLAVIGLGGGGGPAAVAAGGVDVDLLVLVGSSLDRGLLEARTGGLLVLHGADDPAAPGDEVKAMSKDVGHGEWVLYGGVGGAFLDDASDSHDPAAAADATDRIVAFLDTRFGAVSGA